MKRKGKTSLLTAITFLIGFLLWTLLILCVDVQAAGPNGTKVGFAALNLYFHRFTGVHMTIYTITDWLGLVPIVICLCFGVLGLIQTVRRRSILRVDPDIILLGIYYILVILCYTIFEMVPINYRPILINGVLEASYPSSTTLLVLSVMPTLKFQIDRRAKVPFVRNITSIFVIAFSVFMVIGRLIAGVHWATDIVGAVLLSMGLFLLYQYCVKWIDYRVEDTNGIQ
jgi:undecaprenyl-diphosphatase